MRVSPRRNKPTSIKLRGLIVLLLQCSLFVFVFSTCFVWHKVDEVAPFSPSRETSSFSSATSASSFSSLTTTLSSSSPRIPSILLIGAQKASTTSIGKYLKSLPHMCFHNFRRNADERTRERADPKEAHFFDTAEFERGLPYFQSLYRHCHSETDILVDATPQTIMFPGKVKTIYDQHGEGPPDKIIVILREPVSREVSLYNHQRRVLEEAVAAATSNDNDDDDNDDSNDGDDGDDDDDDDSDDGDDDSDGDDDDDDNDEASSKDNRLPDLVAALLYTQDKNSTKGKMGVKSFQQSMHDTVIRDFQNQATNASAGTQQLGYYAHWLRQWFAMFDRKSILILSYKEVQNAPHKVMQRLNDFLEHTEGQHTQSLSSLLLSDLPHANSNTMHYPNPPCDIQRELASYFEGPNQELYNLLEENAQGRPPMEEYPFPKFEMDCTD